MSRVRVNNYSISLDGLATGSGEPLEAQLGHAGLVRSRREGRRIIYSADYAGMQELIAFLTEKCCQPAARGGRARKC